MRIEFPEHVAALPIEEQAAYLQALSSEVVDHHLDEVAQEIVGCLPEDAREYGQRTVTAAATMPLVERYGLLHRLHGYAEALGSSDLQDFQRHNTLRSLGSMAALAERGSGTLAMAGNKVWHS